MGRGDKKSKKGKYSRDRLVSQDQRGLRRKLRRKPANKILNKEQGILNIEY